jgi:hypothetical protein
MILMKGFIYKISHKDSETGINKFQESCYIGQTRVTVKDRWNQHKRACLDFSSDQSLRSKGKSADLYEMMSVIRIENFIVDTLEEFNANTEDSLLGLLDKAENNYIDKFNSIDNGWNKVKPPKNRVSRSNKKSLKQVALENSIAYTSLDYRMTELNETEEDAITHLKKISNEPDILYEYGRQRFKSIRLLAESKIHNPKSIDKKTIERNIRKLKKTGELKIVIDSIKNECIYQITEQVFVANKKKKISVIAPNGKTYKGLITELHRELLIEFHEIVPKNYTTVQGRLLKGWTPREAFGFDYPPNFKDEQILIAKGYKWANGKPDFTSKEFVDSNTIILEIKKEIFASQKEFAETYLLKEDHVSLCIKKGMNAEKILILNKLEP